MATMLPPVKGAAFTFYAALVSTADTDIFKTSPTLAAGDVLVSKDGGDFANIGTLPTQVQSSGVLAVGLSADEMNADIVTVLFHDASGSEWQDALVTIYTSGQTLDTTDGVADAIKAKTDNLPASPAAVGSAMTLADDAITSAKFDESTAFPLKSAASIADAVWDEAISGHKAAGTTGKALSDAGAAGDPWSAPVRTLTQTAAQVAAVLSGSAITVTRGDTTTFSLLDLGDITGYKEVWFTVKENPSSEADSSSVLLIKESAGLVYLNGAAVATPYAATDGDLTVDDDATGDITITIEALATGALSPRGGLSYDVQWKDASDAIHTLTMGTFNVSTDVTRATS